MTASIEEGRRHGARSVAEIYLRETSFLAALSSQSRSLLRRCAGDDALAAHLGRARRRVEILREELGRRGGPPPSIFEAAFRAIGAFVGSLTALGGGERTLRAVGDGARALARIYGRKLSDPMPPDLAYRLAGNYRDVLLLQQWVEDRALAAAVRRRAARAGLPASPGATRRPSPGP